MNLPSYSEIKGSLKPTEDQLAFILESRETIRSILNGNDDRLLIIAGPCSVHDKESTLEYATKLKELSFKLKNRAFLVMRAFCEKPRTAFGWKGYLYDPFLDDSYDMYNGIFLTRKLKLELTALKLPLATEFLDPLTAFYFDDLISWGSIGARTSSSQIHRNLASALTMPVGIKNSLSGDFLTAIHAVLVASEPHAFFHLCPDGKPIISKTKGNKDAHVVLRGGENHPNYDRESVSSLLSQLEALKLPKRVLIDCSHQNSKRIPSQQAVVFQSVIDQIRDGNSSIRGAMLESHLKGGSQHIQLNAKEIVHGLSITDPCLSFQETEELLLSLCKEATIAL